MKSQKSRDKKKAYMNALESKVKELEKMISELEKRCLILQNENEALKSEALESDPGVEEKLMLYYDKLQKDKEKTETSAENQEDAPAKSADSQESFWEKCTENTGQEDSPKIDIDDEVTPETEIKVKCSEVEGIVDRFAETHHLACTSEINEQESSMKFGIANPQEGTVRRCTEIVDNNILNVEECVEQNSLTKRSNSSQQLHN